MFSETPHYEPHQVASFGSNTDTVEIHYASVLAPGEPSDLAIGINTVLDSGILGQVGRGEWVFHIFGRIEYFDFAETPRAVQFCYRYDNKDFEGNPVHW